VATALRTDSLTDSADLQKAERRAQTHARRSGGSEPQLVARVAAISALRKATSPDPLAGAFTAITAARTCLQAMHSSLTPLRTARRPGLFRRPRPRRHVRRRRPFHPRPAYRQRREVRQHVQPLVRLPLRRRQPPLIPCFQCPEDTLKPERATRPVRRTGSARFPLWSPPRHSPSSAWTGVVTSSPC
jgi:hypothetical protein